MTDPKIPGWDPKLIPDQPGKDNRGKVNLKPADFQKLVDRQGVRVRVYRTSYCPNVKSIDGAEHELDCPLCHGTNFLDRLPLDTMAVLQNQTLDKEAFKEGLYDGNSVSATFQGGIELQYFTLVELLDFTDIFFERIKRQDGQIDFLKYPGIRVNMLIDKNGVSYTEGPDYKLDHNGSISWCPEGRRPDAETIYTIHYETLIRFRAVKAMHVNRFGQIANRNAGGHTQFVKLPENWLLQKEYLVTRRDKFTKEELPKNKIRESDDSDSDSDN